MIYIIKCEENGLCKIGFSHNPEERIKSIQTSYPYKLTLDTVVDGDLDVEKKMHERFSSKKTNGEWFVYSKEITDFLLKIGSNKAGNNLSLYISYNGLYDATSLLNWYNSMSESSLKMVDFKKLKSTNNYIDYLCSKKETPLITSIKGTYMHKYLFAEFSIWLSHFFKKNVIDWVFEGMDDSQAGDYYKEMCEALMNQRNVLQKETSFFHYIQEANMLKSICGIHDRDHMTEEQLTILNILQKANIKMIKLGESKERRYTELNKIKIFLS